MIAMLRQPGRTETYVTRAAETGDRDGSRTREAAHVGSPLLGNFL
jgi:hypothetical protein